MKVYVDKDKLESHDIQSITDLGGKEFQQVRMWFKDINNVEILSLSDYTKQVRKEVCKNFKARFLATCQIESGNDTASFSLEVLNRILDQIQDNI